MSQNQCNLRDKALRIGDEYNNLILSMSRISDDFLRALSESGIDATRDLIESRSFLCMELVQCGETLKPLVQELERSGAADDELRRLLADIRSNLLVLNEKQRTCETALSARMDQCRADLLALNQHSVLRRTYHGSREQDARFLDSMR